MLLRYHLFLCIVLTCWLPMIPNDFARHHSNLQILAPWPLKLFAIGLCSKLYKWDVYSWLIKSFGTTSSLCLNGFSRPFDHHRDHYPTQQHYSNIVLLLNNGITSSLRCCGVALSCPVHSCFTCLDYGASVCVVFIVYISHLSYVLTLSSHLQVCTYCISVGTTYLLTFLGMIS